MANALKSTELTLGGGSAVSILGDDRILIGMGESQIGDNDYLYSMSPDYVGGDDERQINNWGTPDVGDMGSFVYRICKTAYSGKNYTYKLILTTPSSGKYVYRWFIKMYKGSGWGAQSIDIANYSFEELMYDPSKGFYTSGSNSLSGFTHSGTSFTPSTLANTSGGSLTPEAGGKTLFNQSFSVEYRTTVFGIMRASWVRLE